MNVVSARGLSECVECMSKCVECEIGLSECVECMSE